MPCSIDYYRKCELCNFVGKTASNWSKHNKTKKHLLALENAELKKQNDKYKMAELERQVAELTMNQSSSSTTINNTQTNTIINITNIFADPSANDLRDINMPPLDDLLETHTTPSQSIQYSILQMGDLKPLLLRNDQLWIKQDKKWEKGDDAEAVLKKWCNQVQHNYINEINNMELTEDNSDEYLRASQYVYDDINKESITHKVKGKMIGAKK